MNQPRVVNRTASRPRDRTAPTVSVIVPTYNREHMIGRALESVLAQEFTDFELIVVDDASTDNTEAVVRASGDSRIRYIREPANGGPNAARNRGMREARGEFLAFLDSDDEWLPGKLGRQVARFSELPDRVGAVYTGVETIDDDGSVSHFVPELRGRLHSKLLARNVLHGASQSIMIRRSVAREAMPWGSGARRRQGGGRPCRWPRYRRDPGAIRRGRWGSRLRRIPWSRPRLGPDPCRRTARDHARRRPCPCPHPMHQTTAGPSMPKRAMHPMTAGP